MRRSIRHSIPILLCALSALASLGLAPPHPTSALAPPSHCGSSIEWNEDQGVWRLVCSDALTCCDFDTLRRPNGVIEVWCDCDANGKRANCCSAVLRVSPEGPRRRVIAVAMGSCEAVCGEHGSYMRCELVYDTSTESGGHSTRAMEARCEAGRIGE